MEVKLDASNDDQRKKAILESAQLIQDASYILVAAGAGFSADSGLPVYHDIAKVDAYRNSNLTYDDLCQPDWIEDEPHLFYGFWGDCFNRYRDSFPHEGYQILNDWMKILPNLSRKQKNSGVKRVKRTTNAKIPSLFVYTSNVDNHFLKSNFPPKQVFACHGTVEKWQCSVPCHNSTWNFESKKRFTINSMDMKLPASEFPICPRCKSLARPNVLMYFDTTYLKDLKGLNWFEKWKDNVAKIVATDVSSSLVILELGEKTVFLFGIVNTNSFVGCGTKVPTVFNMISSMKSELDGNIHHIRINPTPLKINTNNNIKDRPSICIEDTALQAIRQIDKIIREKKDT